MPLPDRIAAWEQNGIGDENSKNVERDQPCMEEL
jgi:hypothetical protein